MTKKRKVDSQTSAQQDHARIMELAAQRPGVAEAMAAFATFDGQSLNIRRGAPVIRYATGGNIAPLDVG